MEQVIGLHPELNGSIFRREPELLYSVADVSLYEIDEDLTTAHFVLFIPQVLESNHTTHQVLKIKQVGTFQGDHLCRYLNLPTHVVERNDVFYDINLQDCKSHNSLILCPSQTIENTTSCLQRDVTSCPLRMRHCPSTCTFEASLMGVLARDNTGQNSFSFDLQGLAKAEHMSTDETIF